MEPVTERRGRFFQNAVLCLCMGVVTLLWQSALSQSDPKTEYKFKAIYLFNLLQFVEWPEESFQGESSPIIIGILGRDSFGEVLDQTVQNEKVQNHEIVVRRFNDLDEVKECHLLFIGKSEKSRTDEVLRKMEKRDVLTVSEVEGFAEHGGAVNFYIEKNKLRFEVNTDALKKANLKVSSKFLRLAKIVGPSSSE